MHPQIITPSAKQQKGVSTTMVAPQEAQSLSCLITHSQGGHLWGVRGTLLAARFHEVVTCVTKHRPQQPGPDLNNMLQRFKDEDG